MKGKRLIELVGELNASERKTLLHRCAGSADKRLGLLAELLKSRTVNAEKWEQRILQFIRKQHEGSSAAAVDATCRRYLEFFSREIENMLLSDLLHEDLLSRNLQLAQYLERKGNPSLLEHYYHKAIRLSGEQNNPAAHIQSLKGMIKLAYKSQEEKNIRKALQLNQDIREQTELFYHQKYCEYYNTITNIYLENADTWSFKPDELVAEIESKISDCPQPVLISDYRISQARLCITNSRFSGYVAQAMQALEKGNLPARDRQVSLRKIYYLDLVAGFYRGAPIAGLIHRANQILKINTAFNFIDDNTLFYRLLLLCLSGRTAEAKNQLAEERRYFKGGGSVLRKFIQALILFQTGSESHALRILSSIMYTPNFYISLFARMLLLHIYLKRNEWMLGESLIASTRRLLQQNKGRQLAYGATQHLLTRLHSIMNGRKPRKTRKNDVQTGHFHAYILQLQHTGRK